MAETTDKPFYVKNSPKTGKKPKWREYAESIIWALLIALIIRTFIVQAFVIPSGSMENTLLIGDHIFVNKFIFGTKIPFTGSKILPLRNPKRGDVIVFIYPEDRSKDFIKRVIGVPGDEIKIINKQVYVNDIPYRNPHEVHKDSSTLPAQDSHRDNLAPVRVPADSYFVMGDNRDNSYDSRFWGFVKSPDILGLAFIKYWSWDKNTWTIHWENIGRPVH